MRHCQVFQCLKNINLGYVAIFPVTKQRQGAMFINDSSCFHYLHVQTFNNDKKAVLQKHAFMFTMLNLTYNNQNVLLLVYFIIYMYMFYNVSLCDKLFCQIYMSTMLRWNLKKHLSKLCFISNLHISIQHQHFYGFVLARFPIKYDTQEYHWTSFNNTDLFTCVTMTTVYIMFSF